MTLFVNASPSLKKARGYSLIELLLASGLLAAGLAAMASMTISSVKMEEMNLSKARAISLAEASATLWQLGMNEDNIKYLLLGDPVIEGCEFTNVANGVKTREGTTLASFDDTKLHTTCILLSLKLGNSTQSLTPIYSVQNAGF